MSDTRKTHKDLIREMVLSLSRGDLDAARKASEKVLEAKGASSLRRMEDEIEDELAEGMMSAGRRHMRSGKKHMSGMDRKRKKMLRDKKHKMDEMNDTGSDSGVVTGKYDNGYHDTTAKKGSVKKSGKIDHKDYDGDKPNAYDHDDPKSMDKKPVND